MSSLRSLTGILPLVIGLSLLTQTFLYESFRFYSFEVSLFTHFYLMFGDTMFDTYYGIQ